MTDYLMFESLGNPSDPEKKTSAKRLKKFDGVSVFGLVFERVELGQIPKISVILKKCAVVTALQF